MSRVETASTSEIVNDSKSRDSRLLYTICILFFFSGFPALIYQLIWQRALFRILGVNIESVTIVVTAFMLGLGIGSIAGGKISKIAWISLLPTLATIEILTGIFGLFSLNLFEVVGKTVIGSPLPVTAFVTLALVVVPTLLMGATLPLLVGYFVKKSGHVGKSVGQLYFINTLGAAAACFFCIAVLFPNAGMKASVLFAAVLNILVAFAAMVIYLRDRKNVVVTAEHRQDQVTAGSPAQGTSFSWILGLSFAGGFVALSHEIFFFRTISYATGSSPIAFAATLGCFLLGLAFGAKEATEICRSTSTTPQQAAFAAVLKAGLLGILFLPISSELVNAGSLYYIGTFLMVLGISFYLGMVLPLLAEIGISADSKAGMETAKLYFANIVGSATGSIVTGFVLMEYISLVGISVFLTVSALMLALLLALSLMQSDTGIKRVSRLVSVGTAVALSLFIIPFATHNVLESLFYKNKLLSTTPFAGLVENRSGILASDNEKRVFGNGMYDGHFNIDPQNVANGVIRPYALSLVHPDPAQILMIGLASGSWAQIVANNPMVEKLTIVEINPGYTQMIEQEPNVASLLTNPKIEIVIDDGRRWLQMNPQSRFDAIISNTTYHHRANATNVLSREFLGMWKEHLNPGGIAIYNSTGSTRVQRTACAEFPHGVRLMNNMIVSQSPIDWNMNRWRDVLRSYTIDGQLIFDVKQESHRNTLKQWRYVGEQHKYLDEKTEKDFIEHCENILSRTVHEDIITDDNMGTEWRYIWKHIL